MTYEEVLADLLGRVGQEVCVMVEIKLEGRRDGFATRDPPATLSLPHADPHG
jgi:hypothetical protein